MKFINDENQGFYIIMVICLAFSFMCYTIYISSKDDQDPMKEAIKAGWTSDGNCMCI